MRAMATKDEKKSQENPFGFLLDPMDVSLSPPLLHAAPCQARIDDEPLSFCLAMMILRLGVIERPSPPRSEGIRSEDSVHPEERVEGVFSVRDAGLSSVTSCGVNCMWRPVC